MPQLATVFYHLANAPKEIKDEHFAEVERYVVLLYQRTSPVSKVNDARKQLFASGSRQLQNIPPTKAALVQKIKRATFQAGHIWEKALVADPMVPSPSNWGWYKQDGQRLPGWTTLPEASKACQELIKCGCKKRCKRNCNCRMSNLECFWAGQCFEDAV